MKLKVDVHEEKLIPILDKQAIDYEIVHLEVGDIVYNDLCFERKTMLDFMGSIQSNRIFEQAQNMTANYPHSFIIISGRLADGYARLKFFNENVVFGAIASLQMRYGVNVLRCETDRELVKQVLKFCQKSDGDTSIHAKRLAISDADVRVAMVSCIPKVGRKRAQLLLEHFSLKQLYDNPEEEIAKVVGKSTAANIKRFFI